MSYWIEQYMPCGCSSDARLKKDLLGYCKYHGGDAKVRYRLPGNVPAKDTDGEDGGSRRHSQVDNET